MIEVENTHPGCPKQAICITNNDRCPYFRGWSEEKYTKCGRDPSMHLPYIFHYSNNYPFKEGFTKIYHSEGKGLKDLKEAYIKGGAGNFIAILFHDVSKQLEIDIPAGEFSKFENKIENMFSVLSDLTHEEYIRIGAK